MPGNLWRSKFKGGYRAAVKKPPKEKVAKGKSIVLSAGLLLLSLN